VGSPDYMKVQHFVMNANNELLVPRGFAHGFITTEDNTVVQYLVDNDYSPKSERSILWASFPEIKDIIDHYQPLIISDKDTKAYTIEEYFDSPAPDYEFNSDDWQGKREVDVTTSYIITAIAGLAILATLIVMAILKLIN